MPLLHPFLASLLPRYASGALPLWLARMVERALQRDPLLAHAYDALRRSERLAAGTTLSPGHTDLLESFIFGDLAPVDRASPQRALGWASLRAASLPAAMAAASFVVFAGFATQRVDDGFSLGALTARGEALAKDAVGVKISCVSADRERVLATATGGARRRADSFTCPHGSLMAFSTTNLGAQTRHVFVLGIAEGGERRWYAPFGRDSGSIPVAAGAVDEVLPSLADTAPMPKGPVALFVLISDTPFAAGALERELSASERRLPLAKLPRLPVDVPLQARIDLLP